MPRYPKHDDVNCGGCVHFCRHYVKYRSRYLPLDVGHRIHLRIKDREEGQNCPNWTPRKAP